MLQGGDQVGLVAARVGEEVAIIEGLAADDGGEAGRGALHVPDGGGEGREECANLGEDGGIDLARRQVRSAPARPTDGQAARRRSHEDTQRVACRCRGRRPRDDER